MIPWLEGAEFVRFESIHRNRFINSPRVLINMLNLRENTNVYLAGQIIVVEGHIESTTMCPCATNHIAADLLGHKIDLPRLITMCGSLIR